MSDNTLKNKQQNDNKLLGEQDVPAYCVINEQGSSSILLVCEHAGRNIPQKLANMGISDKELTRHIAYDIGAKSVALLLSKYLNATLILQNYSRLVIDCNRPIDADDCIPKISDGTVITANLELDKAAIQARYNEIHKPFHQEISRQLDLYQTKKKNTTLISIHSFTPKLKQSDNLRSWHIGLLFNRDKNLAKRLMTQLKRLDETLLLAFNQPYKSSDDSDYTIPVHGEKRNIEHVLIEIRNDLIDRETDQKYWSDLLFRGISAVVPS